MKVNDIILNEHQQLIIEFNLRRAAMAGVVGASLVGAPVQTHVEPTRAAQPQPAPKLTHILPAPKQQIDPRHQKMIDRIVDKYNVDDQFAKQVVALAHKYEKPTFPRAKDILAVVGIESSFDPDSVSGLRKDPAVGLTQIRPGVWNINRAELQGSVEKQIAYGADILQLYFSKLKNKDSAIRAYNIGLSAYRHGNRADGYANKYHNEIKQYNGI